jgi:hypothetical protein
MQRELMLIVLFSEHVKTAFSKPDYARPYLSNVVLGVMHGVL